MSRSIFLRWLLLQALVLSFFVGLGVVYGRQIGGASLVAVPAILGVFVGATAFGGVLSWRADEVLELPRSSYHDPRAAVLHDAEWLGFWAWVCQVAGIMATVFGVWEIVQSSSDATVLVERIQGGLGVALMGTFVGVACSVVLEKERRALEHAMGPS